MFRNHTFGMDIKKSKQGDYYMSKKPTDKQRAEACMKKIGSQFKNTPFHELWKNVLFRSIKDIYYSESNSGNECHKKTALIWLSGPMVEMVMCGLNPDWIRRVIIEAGLICKSDLS